MLTAIILVCMAGVPVQDCTEANASRVIRLPIESRLLNLCLRDGQAYIAETSLGDLAAGEYVKVTCRRKQIVTEQG